MASEEVLTSKHEGKQRILASPVDYLFLFNVGLESSYLSDQIKWLSRTIPDDTVVDGSSSMRKVDETGSLYSREMLKVVWSVTCFDIAFVCFQW